MKNFLYFRALRHVDHTVFCVENGQKTYYDKQFNSHVAYSSGQQVKRSIIDAVMQSLNVTISPTEFIYVVESKDIKPKQPLSICDPTYPDQLLGGWMLAKSKEDSKKKKGKGKKTQDEDEIGEDETDDGTGDSKSETIKRRSPLSISAMRPLHPLLGYVTEENISYDRSSSSEIHKITVRDKQGKVLTDDEIEKFIDLNGPSDLRTRFWVPDKDGSNARTSGLFVYDIAIDMRTLFSVSLNQHEPEINKDTIDKLVSLGWKETKNDFGSCLVAPKEERDKIIPALAHGLINWRITSNQARTFSLMETLAVAISDNANKLAGSIRAKLSEDTEKQRAIPLLDDTAGANIYIALPCDGYIVGASGTANALEDAEKYIIEQLQSYDYENQK
ncbi:MAG: CRISPR-associated protein Cas7 [Ignavibacteria bacterium]|nr:CRISPR-associated protein Cas7 [Ignavibacteria bacterium]